MTTRFVLAGAILAAALLRIHGLAWGAPDFFEEATPLHEAWAMWGFGPEDPDLNPHFFRYPTLTMYLHLIVQLLLYAGMRITGAVHGTLDFEVLRLLNPVPLFVAARTLHVLFGVGTVFLAWALGRRIGGPAAGAIAAILLAVNSLHVSASQMVTVDVPLTFFCTASLLLAVRAAEHLTPARLAAAGAAMGLAASSKYTGAFLLPALLTAWWIGARGRRRQALPALGIALIAAAAAFALTSPYVLLDFRAAWHDLSEERTHMAVGHFGLGSGPAFGRYALALAQDLLGWPAAAALAAALVLLVAVRGRPAAIVLAVFLVSYGAVVGSWAMTADHYLLPLLPPALVLAAVLLADLAQRAASRGMRPAIVAAVGAALLAAPQLLQLPRIYERTRPDSRRLAREFLESNFPPGSFIVREAHGPKVTGTAAIYQLRSELRAGVLSGIRRPIYATLSIPLSQVYPENTAPFYDLSLYADADAVVTTGDVAERYAAEPERFASQLAFYDDLEESWVRVATFEPQGAGSHIRVYRHPEIRPPFGKRKDTLRGPLAMGRDTGHGLLADFCMGQGLAYESYGFVRQAERAYQLGLAAGRFRRGTGARLGVGRARCLVFLGQAEEADRLLAQLAREFPVAEDRAQLADFRRRLPPLVSPGR